MGWRTGEHGYGTLAKALHWLTVLALVAQLVIGYAMEADDSGQGRGRGRSGGSGRGRGRGGDDEALLDLGWSLVTAHVALGALVLVLAVLRVLRRRYDGLPPWAATLSARERRIAHHTERALLALLFVVPLTGLALVAGDDDLLPVHVAAHVALYVAVVAHVGLVLKHQLVDRDRLLARMT